MSGQNIHSDSPAHAPQEEQPVTSQKSVTYQQPQQHTYLPERLQKLPKLSTWSQLHKSFMVRLLCLYPQPWRERYGEELAELLAHERLSLPSLVSTLAGAFDAHRHVGLVQLWHRTPMQEQLRSITLQVFGASVAFFVAAAFLYESVYDMSVGSLPLYTVLIHGHPDLVRSWTLFLIGVVLTFFVMLVGGLPVLLTAIREARRQCPSDLWLLLVPPGALLLLTGCDALEEGLRHAQIVLPMSVGVVLDMTFHLLFLLAAVVCVVAISRFVGHCNITAQLLRYELVPAILVTLGMGLTFGASVNWLAMLHAETPQFFGANALMLGWLILVGGLMVISTVFAGRGVVRGLTLRLVDG